MSSAPSTPMMSLLTDDSLVAAPLRLERLKAERMEGLGSPTSPGMTAGHARREAAEAAAFHNTLSGESSPEDDGDSDTDIPRDCKPNTGRWTDAEHKLFLKGLECFPYRAWKKIATLIKTRSVVQIRTHAQKYYQKLAKEEAKGKDRDFASPFGMDHDRKATSASLKKRKYSFEDSHYSRKLLRERKDADMKLNMEALKPPCLRSSTATDARARNVSVDISVAVNTSGAPSPMLPPRRPVTVSRGMVAFDAPMVVDFPETSVKTDFDPSLERLSPVSADAMPGTDEDWFSSSSTSEVSLKDGTVPEGSAASSPVSMMKKNQFLPIYHCDAAFDFGHDSTDLILFEDEAPSDEFVLDPQTFLTCYFNKES
ncbi:hypothetical protein SDRG_04059 [Saprolegnia diclina VS20]|uniref:HTH myb-type domain-containing protein n=1 Tax=Saprolegnia diclina (strain VS20) TaxID=1156394 RepID=T0S6F9_SAPDV|nr:hypothetical protein SDRG_04059 [Saprolegnia diclina VS20]EQC38342.1 hypothetical protein SDRG_04059 [Saprolegnia diclina VS20]|eukprot:XP_008607934.1 hypothetical protein SDRG_04059 [Saprolegnia diclina VS20]